MAAFEVTAPDGNKYEVNAPEGATEEQALAYAKQQWAAGALTPAQAPMAAQQADVRKAEPAPPSPMAAFEQRAQAFDDAISRFSQTPEGRRYQAISGPDRTRLRQATAKWAGIPDPEPEREKAEIEELAAGGELQYGNTGPYHIAKTLASMGGYAYGGPFGATGAEALVRATALSTNLKKAIDAGAITEDRAAEIMAKEMAAGTTEDLAWNTAIPLLGHVLRNVPGMRGVVAKAAQKLRPGVKPGADEAAQRAAKVAARVKDAQTPAAKQAVEELSQRTGPFVLTPGQVTGKASVAEQTARISGEAKFAAQHEAVKGAAEGMREAALAPAGGSLVGQSEREAIGETIQTIAKSTEQALKRRLRPVFQNADNLGVKVDFSDVMARARAAQIADDAVDGGRLLPNERADLDKILANLKGVPEVPAGVAPTGILDAGGAAITKPTAVVPGEPPLRSAESALDFISRQKEKMRGLSADHKPTPFYKTILDGLQKSADEAYVAAAAKAGKPEVATALKSAQGQYRELMETVYDDAIEQALKTNKPEDIGRFFWQRGNVSEPKQLQRMMALAMREGKMTAEGAKDLTGAMTRGFLQEAVPSIDAAAKWSTMLREKPALRDTWNTLTSAPGGKELRAAMEVLEEASKIAQRSSKDMVGELGMMAMPVRRAAHGILGLSLVTGAISPGIFAAGISIDALTRLMATAYVQGNKGVLNTVARSLRAGSAGTAAGTKAAQAAFPILEQYAAEQGITGLFVKPGEEGQPSEPDPTVGR